MFLAGGWRNSLASQVARLDRAFFRRPTVEVARSLLGCVLHSRFDQALTSGRIVETEAYGGADDPASHAARIVAGRLRMAGPPAVAYVYRSYGIHTMFNIVCESEGQCGAVLIRALEPFVGIDVMVSRRGGKQINKLCSGPGRLCQAMNIQLEHDGIDLTDNPTIWISADDPPSSIGVSGRVGISRARETPWRFFDVNSAAVSTHRSGTLLVDIIGNSDGRRSEFERDGLQ